MSQTIIDTIYANALDAFFLIICLVFSAFFSAAETAITSTGHLKTKHRLEESKSLFEKYALELWLNSPGTIITTILVFNTVANIFCSAIATKLAISYSIDYGVGIATFLTTSIVLVVGEVIPKSYGKAHADTMGFKALMFVAGCYRTIKPLAWFLSKFAERTIHAFGGRDNSVRPTITEEELEFLIEQSRSEGVINHFKTEMLSGVIDFDETIVREVMTPRTAIKAVPDDASFEEVVDICMQTGFSRIPVYKDSPDNIIGIIFAKDILRYMTSAGKDLTRKFSVQEVMRDALFMPETKSIIDVFRELKKSKTHMTILIDEHGGTAGLVTMEDILEEIVGDIQDEFDAEKDKILPIDENTYDVAGNVNLEEFGEYFDLDEDFLDQVEGDVDTLSGFMTHQLGKLPEVGEKAEIGPLQLEVAQVDRKRIERLIVKKPPGAFPITRIGETLPT